MKSLGIIRYFLLMFCCTPLLLAADMSALETQSSDQIELDTQASDELVGFAKGSYLQSLLGWLSDKGTKVVSAALNYSGIKPFVAQYGVNSLRMLAEMLESSNATLSLETLAMLSSSVYKFLLTASMKWGTQYSEADFQSYGDEIKKYADASAKTFVANLVSGGFLSIDRVKDAEIRMAALLRTLATKLGQSKTTNTPAVTTEQRAD